MTIQTSAAPEAGIQTPAAGDTPPAPPTKEQTAAMVAALPAKSSTPVADLASAVQQFVDTDGASVVHRAWKAGMEAQGRPVKEELRLFPRLPEEDVALDKSIAVAVLDKFLEFYLPGLSRAAAAVIEGAQPYDGTDEHDPNKGRFLVPAADLAKLGAVLNKPAGDGKDRLTIQSLDQGGFLERMNLMLHQGNEQLVTAGNHGEIKVVATIKVVAEGGSFLRKIGSTVELKTGKLERWDFQTEAAGKKGAGLTLWTAKAASAHAKEEADKAEAKKRKPRAKKGEQPAEVPAATLETEQPAGEATPDPAAVPAA